MMDVIYAEASMHIRSLEAHADAEHTRRLAFVQQSTHTCSIVSQLNTEMIAYRAGAEQFLCFSQGYFAANRVSVRGQAGLLCPLRSGAPPHFVPHR